LDLVALTKMKVEVYIIIKLEFNSIFNSASTYNG